jgi:hypothetical protein
MVGLWCSAGVIEVVGCYGTRGRCYSTCIRVTAQGSWRVQGEGLSCLGIDLPATTGYNFGKGGWTRASTGVS